MANRYIPPLPFVTWDAEAGKHLNDDNVCVNLMVSAYLTCAEWADSPEDEDWSNAEFSPEARDLAWFECCAFLRLAGCHIRDWSMEQLGHDFWLTRNGHGAGFWDRDFGTEESRKYLSTLAKNMRGVYIYLGDDGQLHID